MTSRKLDAQRAADWMDAMRGGRWATAHAISDAVMSTRDPAMRDNPVEPHHCRWVWDGAPPDGRDVLVRCYHGLGDTLQFARFVPALAARARSVTIEAQPPLVPLLGTMARVVAFDVDTPVPEPRDGVAVEIMELTHMLRTTTDTLPRADYLAAPAASGSRVGLCWRAGEWDPARSIDHDSLWIACDHAGVSTVSLQQGEGVDDDMAKTAALIRSLDLVVTVDTMVAHLAGAMGRDAFVLLRADADWRWQRGERTSWYPQSRLFRQSREGDWLAPLRAVTEALRCRRAG